MKYTKALIAAYNVDNLGGTASLQFACNNDLAFFTGMGFIPIRLVVVPVDSADPATYVPAAYSTPEQKLVQSLGFPETVSLLPTVFSPYHDTPTVVYTDIATGEVADYQALADANRLFVEGYFAETVSVGIAGVKGNDQMFTGLGDGILSVSVANTVNVHSVDVPPTDTVPDGAVLDGGTVIYPRIYKD